MSRNQAKIRLARKKDLGALLALVRKLAKYERLAPPRPSALRRYLKHGFGRNPCFRVLLAEADGEMVGYAFYLFTYSTFLARPTLYLEDIFILPAFRRRGIGVRMLRALARIAKRKGCGRMEWCVLDWNEPAHRFYRKLGARRLRGWCLYRLGERGLRRLCRQRP